MKKLLYIFTLSMLMSSCLISAVTVAMVTKNRRKKAAQREQANAAEQDPLYMDAVPTIDSSRYFYGVYEGTLQPDDSAGVHTVRLQLNKDKTFLLQRKYSEARGWEVDSSGKFSVESIIRIAIEGDKALYYKVEGEKLLRVDIEKSGEVEPILKQIEVF